MNFKELFVHSSAVGSPIHKRAEKILNLKAHVVSERPYPHKGNLDAEDFNASKERLYLGPHEGHFFRKCPGTTGAACCNYFVLNLGVQCNMNCSYCYLQSYINQPVSQIYTNIDSAFQEMDGLRGSGVRVGTGETIDSLSLDDISLYSKSLVEWFAKRPEMTVEFKTKSNNIKNFVNLPHAGNVVVSFSINPQMIVESEEHGTASVLKRLLAAHECAENDFPVAFHIDPMIYVPSWRSHYAQLVDQVCSLFRPEQIKWISLGALRYPPEMKHILRDRFGGDTLSLRAELHLSRDGKLRYDQHLRSEMFDFVLSEFKKRGDYPAFLCMEQSEVWLNTFKATPRQVPAVSELFAPVMI